MLAPAICSPAMERYLSMRETFNPEPVIQTALHDNPGLTREQAFELMDALLQWLAITPEVERGKSIQMLSSVDKLWHAFIINTALYRKFCTNYISFFVDHDPIEARTSHPAQEYANYTLRLLREAFGDRINRRLEFLSEDATCCYWSGIRNENSTCCSQQAQYPVTIP